MHILPDEPFTSRDDKNLAKKKSMLLAGPMAHAAISGSLAHFYPKINPYT